MNIKYKIIIPLSLVALLAAACNSKSTPSANNQSGNAGNNNITAIPQNAQNVVTYTDNGFSPKTLTIKKGDTVVFENKASDDARVASNPHPIHNGYPTTGGCVGSTFDSCANIAPNQAWSFKFDIVGSWGYHNHLNPSEGGTIVVTQPSASAAAFSQSANRLPAKPAAMVTSPTSQPVKTSPSVSASSMPSPAQKNFTVNANDNSANLTTITASKGDIVSIKFNVAANETYHGGLDFRSPNLSTGTIVTGSSKTVSFTATNSFTFIPYWPATNIQKPYVIKVQVE